MKHTPGPWQAHASDDGGFTIVGEGERKLVVASRNGYPDWPLSAESKANAYVIAAAPELLEALGDVLSLALLKWGNLDPDANTLFAVARAAIAKATAKGK